MEYKHTTDEAIKMATKGAMMRANWMNKRSFMSFNNEDGWFIFTPYGNIPFKQVFWDTETTKWAEIG